MSAYMNTMATIIYAEAIVHAIKQDLNTEDLRLEMILQDITDACDHAYTCWRPLTDKDSARLLKLFVKMQHSLVEEKKEPSVFTNFVLGQLDDLIAFIKNPIRRTAILGIYDAIFALHIYFDKNLTKQDSIDDAVNAMKQWRQYIENR